jgi:WD40 repeat protein
MKKQLFFLLFLFLFVSTLSIAQSSLDSLRLVLPVGHQSYVREGLIIDDKNMVITTGEDGMMFIWDAHSGKNLFQIETFNSKPCAIKHLYNHYIVSNYRNNQAVIIDVLTGAIEIIFHKGEFPITGFQFFKERFVTLSTKDGRLITYEIKNNEIHDIRLFSEVNTNAKNMINDFLVIDSLVYSVGWKGDFEVWNLFDNTQIFRKFFNEPLNTVCFNDSNSSLYISSSIGNLYKLNIVNLTLDTLKYHTNNVFDVLYSKKYNCVVSCSSDSTIHIQYVDTVCVVRHQAEVRSISITDDSELLSATSADKTISLFDMEKRLPMGTLWGHTSFVNNSYISKDETYLFSVSSDYSGAIWNLKNLNLSNKLRTRAENKINNIELCSSGKFALFSDKLLYEFDLIKNQTFFATIPNKLVDYNTRTRDIVCLDYDNNVVFKKDTLDVSQKIHAANIQHLELIDSSNLLLSNSLDSDIKITDTRDYSIFFSWQNNDWIRKMKLSKGRKKIAFLGWDDFIKIIDIENKTLIYEGKFDFKIIDFLFDEISNELIILSKDDLKKVCIDKKTSRVLTVKKYKDYSFRQILEYTDDNTYTIATSSGLLINDSIVDFHLDKEIIETLFFKKFLALVLADNSILFKDLNNFQDCFLIYLLNDKNYIIKLPNYPYYMCSKDASKMLHYVTPSLKVIGFEQLDPVYNRPDIVLDSIGKYFGGADDELVANYRQSWEKRIDRLGLDKEKLGKGEIAVPNAEIVDADSIAFDNKAGKLNIKVSANDPKYPLRRFNVFVNEVPLYGSAGISIAHLKKQVWDTTVSVPLSVGENKIQVSVMNELGLENFKYPTYVNYTPTKEIVAKTHYIGIGVNEFKESSHNLKYCVKDVRDLAKAFATQNKNVDTLLFTDQQVTKDNILALKDYLNKTGVNDKVIISCSSHGLLDDSLNFYLAMHDVDFNNPKARGLKYEELESLLDGIPARQKLLLLDACNSGENDKTEILKQELQQKEKNMDSSQVLAARGVIIKLEEENKSNFKKMNELFVNVRNNTGSVIISAAGGQESALEAISVAGKTIENGAFTYSILECLKQNEGKELKVNALKQYAEKRVEEITNGKQKPTSRQETMEVDWGVR